jgi:HPt (histidine-containing phosphotransfer) domain-containing protein
MLGTSGTYDFVGVAEIPAPTLVPDQPIDRTHLFKMTLGDQSLEAEVLRLFERQSAMLLGRMSVSESAKLRALAHTLNGSARGIGAWRVAHAAQAVEAAAADPSLAEPAIAALRAAIEEAVGAIEQLLRTA